MHTATRSLPNLSTWLARRLPETRLSCWAGTPMQAYVANVLFLLLVAVCLAGWQFEHFYYHATYLQRMDLAVLDRGVIFWILCARNLLLLLPALALGALCVWRRRFKLAMNVSGLLAAAVVAWLLIEMDVQRTYGRTLSAFGDYLVQPKTWQLGGGASSHLAAIVPRVALAVVLVGGLLLAGQATVSWVARRWATVGSSHGCAAASVIWAAVAFGPLVAQSAVGQPAALDVLEAAQPTPLAMFSGSRAGCRPFGEPCADARFAEALAGLQATLTTPAWPQKIP
ncbi:MAG: hypothetical protein OES79_08440, partial [Planctomycetota bacterium]|nr:hypothetical protein [Planctomycetota bacterium]